MLLAIGMLITSLVVFKDWFLDAWYIHQLDSQDEETWRQAAAKLIERSSHRAVPSLILRFQNLEGFEPTVSRIIEDQGFGAEVAIQAFAEVLDHPNPEVRAVAIRALGKIGYFSKRASVPLGKALRCPEKGIRLLILRILGDMGPNAAGVVDILLEALEDPTYGDRGDVAYTLGKIGPGAAKAVPALIDLLKHPDISLRSSAALALGDIGPPAKTAVPALVDLLENPEWKKGTDNRTKGIENTLEWRILEALGKIGPGAAEAIPVLTALLKKGSRMGTVAEVLGRMGSDGIPPLIEALQGISGRNRIYIVRALQGFGPEARAALPVIMEILKGDDPYALSHAVDLLSVIAPDHDVVIPDLIESFQEKNQRSPRTKKAFAFLVKLGKPAVKPLIEATRSENGLIRMWAVRTLGEIGLEPDLVIPVLSERISKDDFGLVPGVAVEALGKFGHEARSALPVILNVLEYSGTRPGSDWPYFLLKASWAVWKIQGLTKVAVPNLIDLVRDRDIGERRKEAARILKEIDPAGWIPVEFSRKEFPLQS